MIAHPSVGLGAVLGIGVGTGLLLVLRSTVWNRHPSLDSRVLPYLRDLVPSGQASTSAAARHELFRRADGSAVGSGRRRFAPHTPLGTAERIMAPFLADLALRLGELLGGTSSIRRRLERAGCTASVQEFRVEQVLWGAGGLGLGALLSVAAVAAGRSANPVALALMCLMAGVTGVLLRDRWLGYQVVAREQRMLAEFPTVAELLALAVTAGEGPAGALERVARATRGELSSELGRALAEARTGISLVVALQGIADRTGLAPLSRFVDGIVVAVERGTPLAEVLRAQAGDVRESGRRALLESGGRKEIAMMVPVVFLILPVTVVFALFPGFIGFSFTTP
ncbi:MAG: type II secretion system F family protein [Actinomycetes bacterium]